ncbi:aldose epimerase family protein [Roseibium sp.]|uniref:aldose epimerase family protein n=1 Tax=Roseibium sp. TaxID=1936156 RepID=UPI003A971CF8
MTDLMTTTFPGADIRNCGSSPDGEDILQATIANGGSRATFMTWGASLQDFRREGVDHSLVLGSPDPAAYFGPMLYFGAIVGPVANRVAKGRFELNGKTYSLDRNEAGATTLHGGSKGFGQVNWTLAECSATSCSFAYRHADGTCGFPGNIDVRVRYTLEDDGALLIEIEGQSDALTHFAPAFHGYWNLDGTADVTGHGLTVPAETYLPVDDMLIPLGAPAPVAGTVFDYRVPKAPDAGLDHNFCLYGARSHDLCEMCRLEAGALRLTVESTEPGLQVYAGVGLDTAPFEGNNGKPYGRLAGVAIEPQTWPDTANHPKYPSSLLQPGETYRQVSRFRVTGI